ncbi:class I SAM-dependent methyltransferase [Sulfurisoma sediminicola]|uniref:class I SAM-dependent methyltransferase n=1 Tax=Sulfurisoma sediminicola TaxID=1381557 RepID=UPI000F60E183|nr:class I SAM-dependent methyltransferase [Sulfurisoma sediminicola]
MIKSRIKEIWNEIDRLAEDEEPKALRDSIGEILNGVELSTSVRTPADLATRMAKLASGTNLLDFGCGRGPHRELLERSGFTWTGLEYGSSNAPGMIGVSQSKQISFYDGKRIPFEECSFDAIWSWQALEHVPEPDMALSEISRVLKHTTGVFAGSVSFLEPYHPWSTFGYSPYGLYVILKNTDSDYSLYIQGQM